MPLKLDKLSVLLVEDIAVMQKLIVSVLNELQIKNVNVCSNGADAFATFCRDNHDLVLSDWEMQPMDGIELTRKIRTDRTSPNPFVPIILLTGYSAKQRVIDARDAGVTEFLVKPFTAKDLAQRIAYVINRPRDFIESPAYFGPDRRRKTPPDYAGPFRRTDDQKD